ncbi:hypothetical protein B0I35DRAFT_421015, partial [Stachybotrys elegans]
MPTSTASLFPLPSSAPSPVILRPPLFVQPPPPPPPTSADPSSSAAPPLTPGSSTSHGGGFFRDRKASFRRSSFSSAVRRRASSNTSNSSTEGFVTDAAVPPALPDYALSAAGKVFHLARPPTNSGHTDDSPASPESKAKMLGRTTTSSSGYFPPEQTLSAPYEANMLFNHITEVANKRISTLDYLRKAHEGRVYWFNTYLFDKPDLNRMPYFDPRKLARKATNHLLLGLSLPTISDLYSSTPLEFLRCLNALLSEFDNFQQLHGESSASLARARLPNMFRRPGVKSRRSTSASDMSNGDDAPSSAALGSGSLGSTTPSVMTFAASESDLLPGEEYVYLLTPSLPFEPDFFETFATLCDVLIDTYTKFLQLVPTPRDCSPPVAELFSKADARVRRILVQAVVKEFEDHSRSSAKSEVASIGKVVLGGL